MDPLLLINQKSSNQTEIDPDLEGLVAHFKQEYPERFDYTITSSEKVEQKKNWKYVIYVRKSTDDPRNQVTSIPDQIKACKELANRENLKLISPQIIHEEESAKRSGIRKEFTKMMKMIEAGQIDGIITWHPDRLSRNMLEAGMIIDYLDRGELKDLKFGSFTFTNDHSGKLLLGILFALAKQFSEKLGKDIERGNLLKLIEGKYKAIRKHGYYQDNNGYLQPDGRNWQIIKEAFKMKLNGATDIDCAKYVESQGYMKFDGIKNGEAQRVLHTFKDKKKFGEDVLKDPIYCGILFRNDVIVDLVNSVAEFQPMITVAEYKKINPFKKKREKGKSLENQTKFFSKMIKCGYANDETGEHFLSISVTIKPTARYYKLRCTCKGCSFFGQSVPARIPYYYIKEFLNHDPFKEKDLIHAIQKHINSTYHTQLDKLKNEENSLNRRYTILDAKISENIEEKKKYKDDPTSQTLYVIYGDEITKQKKELDKISEDLANVKKSKDTLKETSESTVLAYELWHQMLDIITKTDNIDDFDKIARIFFTNLTCTKEKVVQIELTDVFKEIFEKESHLWWTPRDSNP